MRASVSELELRATWRALRMVGDFDASMRRPAVRVVLEAAARARAARQTEPRLRDMKCLAAGDTES